MDDNTRGHFMYLCELATTEKNPDKLILLMKEINEILKAKEERVKLRAQISEQDRPKSQA